MLDVCRLHRLSHVQRSRRRARRPEEPGCHSAYGMDPQKVISLAWRMGKPKIAYDFVGHIDNMLLTMRYPIVTWTRRWTLYRINNMSASQTEKHKTLWDGKRPYMRDVHIDTGSFEGPRWVGSTNGTPMEPQNYFMTSSSLLGYLCWSWHVQCTTTTRVHHGA